MTRPRQVCIYLGFNDPREHARGTENVIRCQAEAAPGWHYYVFRGRRSEVFRWGRIIAVAVPWNYLLAMVALRRLLARLSRRARVLIHGHSYILAALLGRTDVFTVHDALTYLKSQQTQQGLWLFRWLESRVYQRTRLIHVISQFSWDQMVGHDRLVRKQVLIPNTIASQVPPCPAAHPHGPRYLLAVRSMEPRSNVELLIDLARDLALREPGTRIVVAGKGPLLEHYRNVASTSGLTNIEFRGFIADDQLHDLYCGADCVVLTALYGEGFGLPLIEAYARGTPAVGSNVCAVPEVIATPDALFNNDLKSLWRAITLARAMPRGEVIAHFEHRFGRSSVLRQYRELYARLR